MFKNKSWKYWYNLDTQVSTWEDPTESGGVVESKGRDDDEVTTPMRRKVPDCIICMDSPACVALMPCWHATYCAGCADKLEKCPQCKTPVEGRQKFYLYPCKREKREREERERQLKLKPSQ